MFVNDYHFYGIICDFRVFDDIFARTKRQIIIISLRPVPSTQVNDINVDDRRRRFTMLIIHEGNGRTREPISFLFTFLAYFKYWLLITHDSTATCHEARTPKNTVQTARRFENVSKDEPETLTVINRQVQYIFHGVSGIMYAAGYRGQGQRSTKQTRNGDIGAT